MRVAADQYVNGAKPQGSASKRLCVELAAPGGVAWAHIAPGDDDLPTHALLITAAGAKPKKVALTVNPSGFWPTVAIEPGAEVSARPGYPRLVLGG